MRSLPPTRAAIIDGQVLAYTLSGKGQPSIVLINGAGGPLLGWFKLYPEIERLGTVMAYDRPGVGDSPRAARPQTGRRVVEQLRALLKAADLQPPYVLVGHSFGGLFANLFARLHSEEVAGVVFLEATAPDDVGSMKQYETPIQRTLSKFISALSKPDPNGEVEHEKETVEEIRAAPPFPPVPVITLSGAKTPPRWMMSSQALAQRAQNQNALAELSPRGERMLARASGHFPQMSEPKLVLGAIRKVVQHVGA
jgi:pimeloyl-ACP methyl ester carboxylesterase